MFKKKHRNVYWSLSPDESHVDIIVGRHGLIFTDFYVFGATPLVQTNLRPSTDNRCAIFSVGSVR